MTEALAQLGALAAFLRAQGYHFVTPTPATHARILARRRRERAQDLRDAFGWSLPFGPALLAPALREALAAAGLLHRRSETFASRVRASSLGDDLLFHSAYPTDDPDAVFFGPDSYRFAAMIGAELARCPAGSGARLLDIGTGTGVGAIAAARACAGLAITVTDVNPAALALAAVNLRLAGVAARASLGADLSRIGGSFDVILANPPYIIDDAGRAYRDGGDRHGAGVSLAMAHEAVPRLRDGGRFLLYTGSAIVAGRDALRDALAALADEARCVLRYRELDPDVFGEELDKPAYRAVERIALVAAVIERPARR